MHFYRKRNVPSKSYGEDPEEDEDDSVGMQLLWHIRSARFIFMIQFMINSIVYNVAYTLTKCCVM